MENPFDGMTVFARVVELGSLSKTAAELNLARSSISETIRRLEARLNVRLLDRTTRRVVPTEAGQAFYARARRALDEARIAVDEAASFHSAMVGKLRVASPEAFTRMHLVPLLPELLKANPGLQIEFVEGVSRVDLLDAKVDLAIRVALDVADHLILRKLGTCSVVIVGSPDYLAQYGHPQHPSELPNHRTVGFSRTHWSHDWRFRRDGEPCNVLVQACLITDAAETMRAAALCGVGLAAVPSWVVAADIAAGTLVRVLGDWETTEAGIYAILPSNRLITAKVRIFTDAVARRVRQLDASPPRA